jgi:hypothetical protein
MGSVAPFYNLHQELADSRRSLGDQRMNPKVADLGATTWLLDGILAEAQAKLSRAIYHDMRLWRSIAAARRSGNQHVKNIAIDQWLEREASSGE